MNFRRSFRLSASATLFVLLGFAVDQHLQFLTLVSVCKKFKLSNEATCANEININNEVVRRLKFGIFITKLLDDIGDN